MLLYLTDWQKHGPNKRVVSGNNAKDSKTPLRRKFDSEFFGNNQKILVIPSRMKVGKTKKNV